MDRDDFDGPRLDTAVWFPHYLPAWSSRRAAAATYVVRDSCLTLSIPVDAPLWCAAEHAEPLRVSGIASGSWSGPIGSSSAQQPFAAGLRVREEQPRLKGWLPEEGQIAIRCRMNLSVRSMAAMWLAGFEEDLADSGELCVVEVFGRSVHGGTAEVGMGVKSKHDPRLVDDFAAPRLAVDIRDFHEYAVTWRAGGEAAFAVDGEVVRRCATAPAYPMQIMIAVFDFPNGHASGDHVPRMDVDWIRHGP